MATTPNLNGALPAVIKLGGVEKPRPSGNDLRATRRVAIGLASITLVANAATGASVAQDNGFWIEGPIPVPYANNKIDNEETGTRSFLKKGIYIANIGTKGRMQRLRRYAFDLLAMADLIAQEDAWNYVRRYLRLKSTFMYFDFDRVISAAPLDDKEPLMDLANRLFDSFEKLLEAVRKQDVPQIYSRYQATTPLLQEVMARMA
ncbi:photosynthetic NDH subunit of lumenal location 3, chloroplastic [Salvia miltiorrhiza]|uniref:photosynthetic NDH subunit of lumenal location 3, chloroplastic n=1 Tax=Salvia miltiorrhiza TaxID=226208 RepID=UPI0025AC33E9|nr:photosynthetic NDH subunit of lumenal location 3, chloroplastic [Salvia miltiorrhiza]